MAWYDDIGSFLSKGWDTAGSLFDSKTYGNLSDFQKLGFGLQIGSSVFSAYQADRAARNQAEAIADAARRNAAAQQNQLDLQQAQLEDQSQQQLSTVQRQSMANKAMITTQAGEAGVSGAILDRLLYAGTQDANEAATNIETNLAGRLGQLEVNRQAIDAQAQSQINQANAAADAQSFNWLGMGLQLGSLALGAAGQSERQGLQAKQSAKQFASNALSTKIS